MGRCRPWVWGLALIACGGRGWPARAEAPATSPTSQPASAVHLDVFNPNDEAVQAVPLVVEVRRLGLPEDFWTGPIQLITADPPPGGPARVAFQIDDMDSSATVSGADHLVFLASVGPRSSRRYTLVPSPARAGPWAFEPAFRVASRGGAILLEEPAYTYHFRKHYSTHASLVLASAAARDEKEPWLDLFWPNVEDWGLADVQRQLGWEAWVSHTAWNRADDVDVRVVANGPVRAVLAAGYRSPYGLFQTVRFIAVYARVGRVAWTDLTGCVEADLPPVHSSRRVGLEFHGSRRRAFAGVGVPAKTIEMHPVDSGGRWAGRYLVLQRSQRTDRIVIAAGRGTAGLVTLRARQERGFPRQEMAIGSGPVALSPLQMHEMRYEVCHLPDRTIHPDRLLPAQPLVLRRADQTIDTDPSPRWTGVSRIDVTPAETPEGTLTVDVELLGAARPADSVWLRWQIEDRPRPDQAALEPARAGRSVSVGRRAVTNGQTRVNFKARGLGVSGQTFLTCTVEAGLWREQWRRALPVEPEVLLRLEPAGPAVWAEFGQTVHLAVGIENRQEQALEDVAVQVVVTGPPWEPTTGPADRPRGIDLPRIAPQSSARVSVPVEMTRPVLVADVRLVRRNQVGEVSAWPLASGRVVLGMKAEDYRQLWAPLVSMAGVWGQARAGLSAGAFLLAVCWSDAAFMDPDRSVERFRRLARLGFDALGRPAPVDRWLPAVVPGEDRDRQAPTLSDAGLTDWLAAAGRGVIPGIAPSFSAPVGWPTAAGPATTDRGLVFANPIGPGTVDLANARTAWNLFRLRREAQQSFDRTAVQFAGRRLIGWLPDWPGWGPPVWLPSWKLDPSLYQHRPVLDVGAMQARKTDLVALRQINLAGHSPSSASAYRAWVAAYYADRSPAEDTNQDGRTLNAEAGTEYKSWSDLTVPGLSDRQGRGHEFFLWMRFREAVAARLEHAADDEQWASLTLPGGDPHALDAAAAFQGHALVDRLWRRRVLACRPADPGGAWTAIGAINRALRRDREKVAVAWVGRSGGPGGASEWAWAAPGARVRRWIDAFGRLERLRGLVLDEWSPGTAFDHAALEEMAWLARWVETQPDFWDEVQAVRPDVAVYWPRESMWYETEFQRQADGTWLADGRHRLDQWGPTALAQAGIFFDTLFTEDILSGALNDYRVLYVFFGSRMPGAVLQEIRRWHDAGGNLLACYDALQGHTRGASLELYEHIFGAIPRLERPTGWAWDTKDPAWPAADLLVRDQRRYQIVGNHPALPASGTWLASVNGLMTFRLTRPETRGLARWEREPVIIASGRSLAVGSRLGQDVAALCPSWLKGVPPDATAGPAPDEGLFHDLMRLLWGFAAHAGSRLPVRVLCKAAGPEERPTQTQPTAGGAPRRGARPSPSPPIDRPAWNVFVGLHRHARRELHLIYLTEHAGRGGTYRVELPDLSGEAAVVDLRSGASVASGVRTGFEIALKPLDVRILAVGPEPEVAALAAVSAGLGSACNYFTFDHLNRLFCFGCAGQGDPPQAGQPAPGPVRIDGRPLAIIGVGDQPTPDERALAERLARLIEERARHLFEPEMPGEPNLTTEEAAWLREVRIPIVPAGQITADMWKRHNVLIVGSASTNAAVARLMEAGALARTHSEAVQSLCPNPYRAGGNLIVIPVRDIGSRRRLERELVEHMALWF